MNLEPMSAASADLLARARTSSVPTLANAVELFGVWAPNRGYTTRPLHCHFPSLGMAVGYATTALVSTDQPPGLRPEPVIEPDYWRYIESVEGPKLAVVQDLDDPPGGAMWGEWNGNVHRALGCVGTITDGAARDLDALASLDFHVFASSVSPSHGYGAFIAFGDPVAVAGLAVRSGDLLAADRHGVLHLPASIPLDEILDVAEEIDRLEREVFTFCQSPGFSVAGLDELTRDVTSRWPRPDRARVPQPPALQDGH
jgi:regulator of RNase E activity RraA